MSALRRHIEDQLCNDENVLIYREKTEGKDVETHCAFIWCEMTWRVWLVTELQVDAQNAAQDNEKISGLQRRAVTGRDWRDNQSTQRTKNYRVEKVMKI